MTGYWKDLPQIFEAPPFFLAPLLFRSTSISPNYLSPFENTFAHPAIASAIPSLRELSQSFLQVLRLVYIFWFDPKHGAQVATC